MSNSSSTSSSSSSVKKIYESLLNAFSNQNETSYTRSLYIYFKLFFFYPAKYLVLLYIFIVIFYILNLSIKAGTLSYKHIKGAGRVFYACASGQKCNKKNKGKDCCELNLIVFSVTDIFKLLMAILELLLGIIYLCAMLLLILAAAMCSIPFSYISPHYTATI